MTEKECNWYLRYVQPTVATADKKNDPDDSAVPPTPEHLEQFISQLVNDIYLQALDCMTISIGGHGHRGNRLSKRQFNHYLDTVDKLKQHWFKCDQKKSYYFHQNLNGRLTRSSLVPFVRLCCFQMSIKISNKKQSPSISCHWQNENLQGVCGHEMSILGMDSNWRPTAVHTPISSLLSSVQSEVSSVEHLFSWNLAVIDHLRMVFSLVPRLWRPPLDNNQKYHLREAANSVVTMFSMKTRTKSRQEATNRNAEPLFGANCDLETAPSYTSLGPTCSQIRDIFFFLNQNLPPVDGIASKSPLLVPPPDKIADFLSITASHPVSTPSLTKFFCWIFRLNFPFFGRVEIFCQQLKEKTRNVLKVVHRKMKRQLDRHNPSKKESQHDQRKPMETSWLVEHPEDDQNTFDTVTLNDCISTTIPAISSSKYLQQLDTKHKKNRANFNESRNKHKLSGTKLQYMRAQSKSSSFLSRKAQDPSKLPRSPSRRSLSVAQSQSSLPTHDILSLSGSLFSLSSNKRIHSSAWQRRSPGATPPHIDDRTPRTLRKDRLKIKNFFRRLEHDTHMRSRSKCGRRSKKKHPSRSKFKIRRKPKTLTTI